jgi:hypothetical protein
MKLAEFKSLLQANHGKPFRLLLPTGSPVPVSFHITEVGRVQKTFLDCGGTLRNSDTCQLQVWVGSDEDHRLSSSKIADILEKARGFLPDENVPVEIEYEDGVVSQYPVEGHTQTDGAVVFRLGRKHTDCLAKERCGIPSPAVEDPRLESDAAAPCCGGSRCG